jgi:hypothetical protein
LFWLVYENDISIYRAAKEVGVGYSTAKTIFSKSGGKQNIGKKLLSNPRGLNERIPVQKTPEPSEHQFQHDQRRENPTEIQPLSSAAPQPIHFLSLGTAVLFLYSPIFFPTALE